MTNPYAAAWKQFEGETREHQLTVLHDDGGGYRHLRMTKPRTRIWSWDVITWPCHLAFTGDIGNGCILRRDTDMLAWIGFHRRRYSDGAPHISPDYWAEKLATGRDGVREFSPELFLNEVQEYLQEDAALTDRDIERLLEEAESASDYRESAYEFLRDREEFCDAGWEDWRTDEFQHHWLLTCYALATTAEAWANREGLIS